jgi:hypothetical protein
VTSKGRNLFCRGGVDKPAYRGDAISRNACAFGVFSHGGLVRSEINAIHLIASYVAMQPLDLGTHGPENANRFLRHFAQLGVGQISGSRDFTFDYEFWQGRPPNGTYASMQVKRLQSAFKKLYPF